MNGKSHCHHINSINVKIKREYGAMNWTRNKVIIMHHMFCLNMASSSVDVPSATVWPVNRSCFSNFFQVWHSEMKVEPLGTLMFRTGIDTVMTSTTEATISPPGSVPFISFPDWCFSLFILITNLGLYVILFAAIKSTLCFSFFLLPSVCSQCEGFSTFHI